MDKEPENAEEALYQGLVMQMLPNQTKTERKELNDIISNLTEMLPEHVVNMCKFNALCKFLGIGEKSE
jgi:hypothetical protein